MKEHDRADTSCPSLFFAVKFIESEAEAGPELSFRSFSAGIRGKACYDLLLVRDVKLLGMGLVLHAPLLPVQPYISFSFVLSAGLGGSGPYFSTPGPLLAEDLREMLEFTAIRLWTGASNCTCLQAADVQLRRAFEDDEIEAATGLLELQGLVTSSCSVFR